MAVLLAAFISCEKTPVDDGEGNNSGSTNLPPEPSIERFHKNRSVESSILKTKIKYSIFLPASYEENLEKSYPVVYFLHGLGESSSKDWTKYTDVIKSLENAGLQEMIYVFPNGSNSYYSNRYDGTYDYMDMFIEELVPYIDATYRTVADKQHRAITGYSMGGFGAMTLAIRHTETF